MPSWGNDRTTYSWRSWGNDRHSKPYQASWGSWGSPKQQKTRKPYFVCTACSSWMYEDRANKAGNICRCGQSFEESSSESGDSLGKVATANNRLLSRLGQINFEGFGDDGKELARLVEAARAELASAAVPPPAPPPTLNERLATSRKALQHRQQLLNQQDAKATRILKAEEALAQLRNELAELDVQITEATRLFDLAESELRYSQRAAEPADIDLADQDDASEEDSEMRDLNEELVMLHKRVAARKLVVARKGNGALRASGKTGKPKEAGNINSELVLQGAGAPGAAPGAAGAGLASGGGTRE